jgi:hypothetical protein
MSRWETDLINGRETEKEWGNILEEQGWSIEIPEGKFSEYDLKATADNNPITFEVKTDQMAMGTKNVAIEIERENVEGVIEKSGLSISVADFYVYKILHKPFFYYVSTENLRNFIDKSNYRKIKGGDGGRSIMVLVPIDDFISQCQSVKRKILNEFKNR